jgi:hypothetical protein
VKQPRTGAASDAGGRKKKPTKAPARTDLELKRMIPPKQPKARLRPTRDPTVLLFKKLFENRPEAGAPPGPGKGAGSVDGGLYAGDRYGR